MSTFVASGCRIAYALAAADAGGAGRLSAQANGVMQATATVLDFSRSTSAIADARLAAQRGVAKVVAHSAGVRTADGTARIDLDLVPASSPGAPSGPPMTRLRITVTYLD